MNIYGFYKKKIEYIIFKVVEEKLIYFLGSRKRE